MTLDVKDASTQLSTKYLQKPAGRQTVVLPQMFPLSSDNSDEEKLRRNSGYWTSGSLNTIIRNYKIKKKDIDTVILLAHL